MKTATTSISDDGFRLTAEGTAWAGPREPKGSPETSPTRESTSTPRGKRFGRRKVVTGAETVGHNQDFNAQEDLDLPESKIGQLLLGAVESALENAQPSAEQRVRRMQARDPGISREQMSIKLARRFRNAVAASGAASGAAALAPGVGTAAATAAAFTDFGFYMREAAIYVLAMAHIHGVRALDAEERRAVVLMVLIGGSLSGATNKAIVQVAPNASKIIVEKVPAHVLRELNKMLGRHFITKYGTKSGGLILAKHIPLGVGAVVGGGANAAFATQTIRSARKTFADARVADLGGPESWRTREQSDLAHTPEHLPADM